MTSVQIATRIDSNEKKIFEQTANELGITPAIALKIFIAKFNAEHGFPFELKVTQKVEPFETEEEATTFVSDLAFMVGEENETW